MPGFLAMIIPVDSGAHPSHPIAPGGPPLGIWGGGGVGNYPDAGFPGPQPPYPPRPWGPINYPDQSLPGNQPIAGWGPGFPTNPIVLPPVTPGGPPVQIWPSPGPLPHPDQSLPGAQPIPSHPIVIPPLPPAPPEGVKPPPPEGGWGYAPNAGWGYFPGTGAEAGPKATKK